MRPRTVQRDDGTWCTAQFSEDRVYRYEMTRCWTPGGNWVAFIGLNPSTADETTDDPTLRRCIRFAQDWGANGLVMLNAFAFRATDPKVMLVQPEPVGPDNDAFIANRVQGVTSVVCCWGVYGAHRDRSRQLRALLDIYSPVAPSVFGLTQQGYPKHPLYLPKAALTKPWR